MLGIRGCGAEGCDGSHGRFTCSDRCGSLKFACQRRVDDGFKSGGLNQQGGNLRSESFKIMFCKWLNQSYI